MPAVTIHYPRGGMDSTDKERFKRTVKSQVAVLMDAIDPMTGEKTKYGRNPDAFIDLVLVPYEPDDAELTTPYLATIVSYEWPDRMANIDERINEITNNVRMGFTVDMVDRYPETANLISFTFLSKKPGAWAMA